MDSELQTLLVPLEEVQFVPEGSVDSGYKYRYRLNLNPGTSRHLLESTEEIVVRNASREKEQRDLLCLHVRGKTRITHEGGDHAPIYLPAGRYAARVLLEFDPWTETEIAVFD